MLAAGGAAAAKTYLTLTARLAGPAVLEVEVEAARGRLRLPLVLAARLSSAVGVLHRAVHPHEGDLPDRHAMEDRDRQVGEVGQLQGEVAGEPRIHETGSAV